MQLRADQLAGHLARGLGPLYTVYGDEPLLAQEAADAIRAAARAAGHVERKVFTVSGAHFDWSAVLGSAQARSLFAERQLIEIRMPSGKPGKEGALALQRYCQAPADDVLTLVQLPRLDSQQIKSAWFGALDAAGVLVRVEPVERRDLPAWIGRRLSAQGQQVESGEAGERALGFFADRVEGNLLAAHQELQKLALLYPGARVGVDEVEAAVLDVARFGIAQFGESVLAGRTGRALRMLASLRAAGEPAVLVLWTLAEDIRALKRVHDAVAQGRPLPMALREQRVWGTKERLFERMLPRFDAAALARLLEAASCCDGIVKGLKPAGWPADPWQALSRLALLVLERTDAGAVDAVDGSGLALKA